MASSTTRIRVKVDKARCVAHLEDFVLALRDEVPAALDSIAGDTTARARTLLTMRINVERRANPHRHTRSPSPPEEPPAMVSGDLALSVDHGDAHTTGHDAWSVTVGSSLVYSRIQELGGASGRGHRTHLPPRPYLSRAWDENLALGLPRRRMTDAIKRAWDET